MSTLVPASFQTKFLNNVEMALQQMQDPLLDAVTVQDDTSAEKIKIKDIIGNNAPIEADERHGDTKYNNTPFDGVWLAKPNELYDADLIDNADKLATSIDIQGATTMSQAGTVQRARSRRILEGFYGSIISGKDGTVTTPFPAGNVVPVTVGGASGPQRLNVAKLRAANKMLRQNYVGSGLQKYMILTAEQNDDLLTEIPATSSDFKVSFKGEVDDEGNLTRLLGWRFIHMELNNPLLGPIQQLSVDGSGYRKTPFWVKPGIVANFWQRLRPMIDPLPQKLGSIQAFMGTTIAATRTQAGMSGVILNSEA